MRILSLLTPAFLALSALIVVWDVFLAGQIAQLRKAPRPFRTLTALVGLLVAPGLVVELASGSLVTGRTISFVTWLWPMVLVLFAAQAVYAVARRLVSPLIGLPIALYDVLVAGAGLVRYAGSLGADVSPSLLAFTAAQASALGLVTGAAALASPFAVQIPILAPAYPARWRWSGGLRATLAFVAGVSAALMLVEIPPSVRAVASYARYSTQLVQEHPAGDFAVGLKVFPDLDGPPPAIALRSDLQLADTMGVDAVLVVVDPGGARAAALDSVAHSLDQLRRDSTLLIVALGYDGDDGLRLQRSRAQYFATRLADVRRIAQRLRPTTCCPRSSRTAAARGCSARCRRRSGSTTTRARPSPLTVWIAAFAWASPPPATAVATARSTCGRPPPPPPSTSSASPSIPRSAAASRSRAAPAPQTDGCAPTALRSRSTGCSPPAATPPRTVSAARSGPSGVHSPGPRAAPASADSSSPTPATTTPSPACAPRAAASAPPPGQSCGRREGCERRPRRRHQRRSSRLSRGSRKSERGKTVRAPR